MTKEPSRARTHEHAYTHARALTHAYTHARALKYADTDTQTRRHTDKQTHMRARARSAPLYNGGDTRISESARVRLNGMRHSSPTDVLCGTALPLSCVTATFGATPFISALRADTRLPTLAAARYNNAACDQIQTRPQKFTRALTQRDASHAPCTTPTTHATPPRRGTYMAAA
jgi:hypothetical protein